MSFHDNDSDRNEEWDNAFFATTGQQMLLWQVVVGYNVNNEDVK